MNTQELIIRARARWSEYSRSHVTDRLWPIWDILRHNPIVLTDREHELLSDFIKKDLDQLHRTVYYQDGIFITEQNLMLTKLQIRKKSRRSAK